jgi:DoxX-like family
MTHLGYPPYFILGVWKLLGGLVILLPALPLLKEWAYAGMIFDLTGATASHLAMGDDLRHIVTPLVIAAPTQALCHSLASHAASLEFVSSPHDGDGRCNRCAAELSRNLRAWRTK